VLIVALVMLAANVAGFAAIAATPWYQGVLQLWAMASVAAGALVGFIFGVPKWTRPKTITSQRERYEPNTNIEKLSDWLTKMLVGVGLVEFHELGPLINRMSDRMTAGLALRGGAKRSALEAHALGNAIIVYFFVAGAIQGFLLTRMFLSRAWQSDEARTAGTDEAPVSGGSPLDSSDRADLRTTWIREVCCRAPALWYNARHEPVDLRPQCDAGRVHRPSRGPRG
jgi:hypothetical protein